MTTKTANLELVEVEDQDVGAGAAPGFNESYDKLDALVQLSVLSATTTAPPVTPRQGDRYIIPTTVTAGNAWTPYPRRVAYYGADGWVFMTPKPGWEAYVVDADRTFIFKTTDWVDIGFVLASTLTTKGDLLGYTGTATARQPVGSNGQILFADSTKTTGVDWKSLFTAKGQLLGFDGTTIQDIAAGADGTVLTAQASAMAGWSWQAGGGGGGGSGNVTPDTHPSSANAMDDEFEAGISGHIDTSKWTVYVGTASLWTIDKGSVFPAPSPGQVMQPLPAGTWRFRLKMFVQQASQQGGFVIWNRTTGKGYNVFQFSGGTCYIQLGNVTTLGAYSFNANLVNANLVNIAFGPLYLDVVYDGTHLTASYSNTGYEGSFLANTARTVATDIGGALLEIGLGLGGYAANYDWFRRLA